MANVSWLARAIEQAIELCQTIGYRHGEGVNQVNLGLLHHMMGRIASSLSSYERAAAIFGELANVRGEAMVLANSAWARLEVLGDHERAHVGCREGQAAVQ